LQVSLKIAWKNSQNSFDSKTRTDLRALFTHFKKKKKPLAILVFLLQDAKSDKDKNAISNQSAAPQAEGAKDATIPNP